MKTKKIIIGISASIALYKTPGLIRLLLKAGHRCRAVMSENSARLMSPQVFEALTGDHVYINEFESSRKSGMDHISLKNWGDLLIYYPATANLLGQLASGIAPSLITTLFLAFKGPVFVAPAMNPDMYCHPIVQKNLDKLRKNGVKILDPEEGILACNEEGQGKLMAPENAIRFLKENGII